MQQAQPTAILLVEDNDTARRSLTHILERAGYFVEAFADGEAAITFLNTPTEGRRFTVVLTDLLLREVDGLGVLRCARELSDPPEVILLTGYGTMHTAIEALRSGAFDYLLKPCKPEELLRCVARAVHRSTTRRAQSTAMRYFAEGLAQLQSGHQPAHAETTTPLEPTGPSLGATATSVRQPLSQLGKLSIDRRSRSVHFSGQSILLTATEYALLCCLLDANGCMVTYSQLAQCAHGQLLEAGAAHQMLKTHIYNLRHKLDPEYIVNVRSMGYRLIDPSQT
ncbi:response regulator transcription factor [Candidatus Gracilibacteria bacterium]|nr:response regulator transcription factor [Candidatus Gracilibacteria bacterium]